ncbi:exopolysaccharide biosynthesis polyprenyl glycosylphosphotransferase [Microvirga terrestris]|uniref:Exopolysaccharide biosynthesis polyprenyl glycosylphosphotransferase n=1 Tax=Microvirga terrestris TaxID=2791024 RepID=A0ABS0HWI3_9HYPH|nr:exopolysaccharide biosynthesis polyprenyl glycosylphosphotransferase [Microvirga terrestris]MBF9197525.1 exopolysaccharide biosynthesis polyprenyl glycosylphosphotransferase [Microvirga terrestris]
MSQVATVRTLWIGLKSERPLKRVSSYVGSSSKRMLDLTLALSLLIIFSPLILIIALAIKSTSPGPIFFRQKRYGARQLPFMILKFRSMHHTKLVEHDVKQATQGDPRVTPIGHFLRKTSLDELPQLFNVVLGEMSIIGPRPHAVCHDDHYIRRIPQYARRFCVRPGITGLAQVCGARGETRTEGDMQRRIDLDIQYIENGSLLLDMKILVATAHEVCFSANAY